MVLCLQLATTILLAQLGPRQILADGAKQMTRIINEQLIKKSPYALLHRAPRVTFVLSSIELY